MKNFKFLIFFCLFFSLNSPCVDASNKTILMATTSSADNTGLLDYLEPYFTKSTGIELRWVVTGTGKAFELGKKCDVDLLFVHEPKSEIKYLNDGFGIKRRNVMFNNFVLLGPLSDPANIKGMDILKALKKIRESDSIFISRGDMSGTHVCEMNLWNDCKINIKNNESWYIESGQGMLATLNLAVELGGYTISDMATYIKYSEISENCMPYKIFVEGGENLKNQYSIILINPKKCSNCNFKDAAIFLDWITGTKGQKLIGDFQLNKQNFFIPNFK